MAIKLRFFHDVTLDSGRDTHFFFREFYKFFDYLEEHYAIGAPFDIDNYRINTNKIKMATNGSYFNNINGSRVTYVIEYERSEEDPVVFTFYRCYFVKSYEIQSGYIIFDIEHDKWANNIEKAIIYGLDIKRCNHILGNGIYDEVNHTKGSYDLEYLEGMNEEGYTCIGANHVAIALLLQFNISQQVFGDDKISRTMLFITDSAEWVYTDHKTSIQSAYKYSSYLELLAGAVGTITGVSGNLGTLDAQVIKAWVVDTQRIDYGWNTWHINASCKYGGGSITLELTYLEPMETTEHFRIENVTPNKVYYVGTYLNGLKLKPYYEKYNKKQVLNFDLNYIVDDNEVKIIASQGERIKDITNMFELYLNTNASQTTALRLFARSWSQSVGMGKGAISSFTSAGGGGAGAVMAGLEITKGIADMIPQNPSFENAIGGGDAMRTFALPCQIEDDENVLAPYVRSPYVITKYDSAFDEEQNAGVYGLNYERTYLYSLDDLFDENYPRINEYYRTYLQCECEIEGAQIDDANYITNELRRGIFISNINEYD